jgi:hypothetical protein
MQDLRQERWRHHWHLRRSDVTVQQASVRNPGLRQGDAHLAVRGPLSVDRGRMLRRHLSSPVSGGPDPPGQAVQRLHLLRGLRQTADVSLPATGGDEGAVSIWCRTDIASEAACEQACLPTPPFDIGGVWTPGRPDLGVCGLEPASHTDDDGNVYGALFPCA